MTSAKEGWVFKQGGITSGFNKKYAVLQYNLLLIFDKEPGKNRGEPKSSINLTECTIRPAEGIRRFGFQLNLPNHKKGKQLIFAANNQEELNEWNEAIKEAAKVVKPAERTPPKLPGRWDPPTPAPTNAYNNKNNRGGGPSGNVLEKIPEPTPVQAPQQQVYYTQTQQQQYYAPPQQQYYAHPPQQQQQPVYYQAPPQQQYYAPQQQPQPQFYAQQHQQHPPQARQYYAPPQQPQYHAPQHQQQRQPNVLNQMPSAPTSDPTAFPQVPQSAPALDPKQSSSSMYPNLKQLQ